MPSRRRDKDATILHCVAVGGEDSRQRPAAAQQRVERGPRIAWHVNGDDNRRGKSGREMFCEIEQGLYTTSRCADGQDIAVGHFALLAVRKTRSDATTALPLSSLMC